MVMEISNSTRTFQLKGGIITLTVMHLFSGDLTKIADELSQTIAKAPKFFNNTPIIIDLNEFPLTANLDLQKLRTLMQQQHIIPLGIRGGDEMTQQKAQALGLAIFNNSTQQQLQKAEKIKANSKKKESAPAQIETNAHPSTKIITQPVRSGQQIYAKGGDLIILAAVSHGAEILADGNIHVYDALRGRALAGIMGNTEAHIFCKTFEAELISIAGRYLVNEQLSNYKNKNHLHIYLERDQLLVKEMG